MEKLKVPKPVSIGLLLSYKCNISCRDCIYACSPKWDARWISIEDARKVLSQLSPMLNQALPPQAGRISFSCGLHFTGGEPFLNYDLLLELASMAQEENIPLPFVETNCFWAKDDRQTDKKLRELKAAGLKGFLLSVNPFNIEHIPFERTKRAVGIAENIFGPNAIVYQQFYYHLFKKLNLEGTMGFERLLSIIGSESLSRYIELLPMGRAAYKLGGLYEKHPASSFFNQNCLRELTRDWHTHIDNYLNYVPGFCAGLSLGKASSLTELFKEINLNNKPILKSLTQSMKSLYKIGESYGYSPDPQGYISKCHLCTDIRKHLVSHDERFEELSPAEYYSNL